MPKRKGDVAMDAALKNLTTEERKRLLTMLARELLAGSEDEKPVASLDWTKVRKKCPKEGPSCIGTGFVEPDFGVRRVNGEESPQSYCKRCRSKASVYEPVKDDRRSREYRQRIASQRGARKKN
jgi:hypothetical protein